MGRRSYEFFGVRWRPRSGELADRLNSIPKYVVSSTLEDPGWNNTTVLTGNLVTEVSRLKFSETSANKPMRLIDTNTIGDGLAFLTYEFARKAH